MTRSDGLVTSLTIKTSSRDQQQKAHIRASPQEDFLLSDHFQTMQTDCLFKSEFKSVFYHRLQRPKPPLAGISLTPWPHDGFRWTYLKGPTLRKLLGCRDSWIRISGLNQVFQEPHMHFFITVGVISNICNNEVRVLLDYWYSCHFLSYLWKEGIFPGFFPLKHFKSHQRLENEVFMLSYFCLKIFSRLILLYGDRSFDWNGVLEDYGNCLWIKWAMK